MKIPDLSDIVGLVGIVLLAAGLASYSLSLAAIVIGSLLLIVWLAAFILAATRRRRTP